MYTECGIGEILLIVASNVQQKKELVRVEIYPKSVTETSIL